MVNFPVLRSKHFIKSVTFDSDGIIFVVASNDFGSTNGGRDGAEAVDC